MQTASDIQNERKRHFFIFCSRLMIFTILLMAFVDLGEKDTNEFIADLVVLSVLLGGLAAIRLTQQEMPIFRTVIFLICLNFYYAIGIGAGEETVLFWAFFMPPLFFYFFGKREGMAWGFIFFISIGLLMLTAPFFNGHVYPKVVLSRFLISFPVVTIVCFGLESSRDLFSRLLDNKNQQLIKEKDELKKALKEINTLNGLIPICAGCKNIRNDEGYWERVETYIEARSSADFTHGLCPSCTKRLYPNLKIKKQ